MMTFQLPTHYLNICVAMCHSGKNIGLNARNNSGWIASKEGHKDIWNKFDVMDSKETEQIFRQCWNLESRIKKAKYQVLELKNSLLLLSSLKERRKKSFGPTASFASWGRRRQQEPDQVADVKR